jgi:hypothetical protein
MGLPGSELTKPKLYEPRRVSKLDQATEIQSTKKLKTVHISDYRLLTSAPRWLFHIRGN